MVSFNDWFKSTLTCKNLGDAELVEYNGRIWSIYLKHVCATVSENYTLPKNVVALLRLSSVVKHFGFPIEIGLSDDRLYMNEYHCGYCTGILYTNNTCWKRQDSYMCNNCYHSLNLNKNAFILSHVTDFNCFDWVRFMAELQCPDTNYVYYVNCNPKSTDYGKVISTSIEYADYKIYNIGSFDTLISRLHEWIIQTTTAPSIESVHRFLNSKIEGHLLPLTGGERVTNKVALESFYDPFLMGDLRNDLNFVQLYDDRFTRSFSEWLLYKK